MNDKLKKLSEWLDFEIENQEELKIEWAPLSFDWNKGYLEALIDMKKELDNE